MYGYTDPGQADPGPRISIYFLRVWAKRGWIPIQGLGSAHPGSVHPYTWRSPTGGPLDPFFSIAVWASRRHPRY